MPTLQEIIGFGASLLNANSLPGTLATASCSRHTLDGPYTDWSLEIESHKTDAFFRAGDEYTFTATGVSLAAFYVQVTGNTPPPVGYAADALMAVIDENQTAFVRVKYDNGGNLLLNDSASNQIDNVGISGATWYRVILLFQPGEAAGDWAWYVDTAGDALTFRGGTAAFGGGDAKADFSGPAGSKQALRMGGQIGDPLPAPGGNMSCRFSDAYMMDDVADVGDAVGVAAGKTSDYQVVVEDGVIELASVTPDCDENGTAGAGDDLDGGTTPDWADSGDGTDATECTYVLAAHGVGPVVTKGGACKVPGPASTRLDYIYGVKFWICHKSPAGMSLVYGRYSPREDIYTVNTLALRAAAAAFRYQSVVEDWPSIIGEFAATYDAQGLLGMVQVSGGKAARTGRFAEGGFMTLQAIPLVTGVPNIGRFDGGWRNQKGNPL